MFCLALNQLKNELLQNEGSWFPNSKTYRSAMFASILHGRRFSKFVNVFVYKQAKDKCNRN